MIWHVIRYALLATIIVITFIGVLLELHMPRRPRYIPRPTGPTRTPIDYYPSVREDKE